MGVGLKSDSLIEINQSLDELEELAYTAGATPLAKLTQVLSSYNASTLIGTGKIKEIKELITHFTEEIKNQKAFFVVIDHFLSGSQIRNLEKLLEVRVLTRNQLILDIFAQRAQSYEGKLQVELAQLLDQLPRVVGGWLGSLSRQAGGIGTRGPGETALEIDRRRIREKIKTIRKKLEQVRKNRALRRQKRCQNKVPSFALIGYTNSGKSTLLNLLTQSQVLTQDQVFATLDPATRKFTLPQLGPALLTDTVGFIRKLPTHLIEAFKSTLEESSYADILIHVADFSHDQVEIQMQIVQKLITQLKWDHKPIITVLNKLDLALKKDSQICLKFNRKEIPNPLFISAITGQGLVQLQNTMVEKVQMLNQKVKLCFPHKKKYLLYKLNKIAHVLKSKPNSQGIFCHAHLTPQQIHEWKNYVVATDKV